MGNPIVHYAVGLAVVSAFGYRGRDRALLSLFAIAPDIDSLTAIPWLMVAPSLDLGATTLTWLTWLFSHHGLLHSFVTAGVVGAVAGLWTRSGHWGTTAFLAWSSHPLVDGLTLASVRPLLPLSTEPLEVPLVTTNDPLVTLVSLTVVASVIAPLVARWIPDQEVRTELEAIAATTRQVALKALPVAFVLAASVVPATAALSEATVEQTLPNLAPRTVLVIPGEHTYHVEHRTVPWEDTPGREVPRLVTGPNVTEEEGRSYAEASTCTMENLGPWDGIDRPTYHVAVENGTTTVWVTDLQRNVTQQTGAALVLTYRDGIVVDGEVAPDIGNRFSFTVEVPRSVLDRAACLVAQAPAS